MSIRDELEWINFYDQRTNIKEKLYGARVDRHLVVTAYRSKWRIFQVYGGLPIFNAWIATIEDAVQIAKFISEKYGEFLSIWEVWTDVDVLAIARLSIPDGEAIYQALQELDDQNKLISYRDFINLVNEKLRCQTCPTS